MNASVAAPPGAPAFSGKVASAIQAALALRSRETPRTRHRDGNAARYVNRLALEGSPYLLQHAHNPVNWYPWGADAFTQAKETGKPVFLSIGYSTCHWCHVMEEESFEDLEIARFLNEHFIPIKVDREERPDVDTVYMTAVQALTGAGGWPMSVWLDAERRPFFAGTYFPARDGDRGTGAGFLTILRRMSSLYAQDPARVAQAAASITGAVAEMMSGTAPAAGLPDTSSLQRAFEYYERTFDARNGGMRGAPKFPSSFPVRLLLRYHRRSGDALSLEMAVRTLERMAAGGMHDQIAGGFHRYSVDAQWLIPHFEKMLYDNALLALAYVEAWQVTGRDDFSRIARTTLDYVLREMKAPGGGFYSATDADSEGEEGTFFLWSEAEIRAALGSSAQRFIDFYGVSAQGNFEDSNILFVPRPDEREWEALSDARAVLLARRELRAHPLRDDKILAAWNGLMISALAVAGRVLGERRYSEAAGAAASFVANELHVAGRLQRSWKDGQTSGPGFLEDQAFMTAAFLDLYEATFDPRALAQAIGFAEQTQTLFADSENGGWFRTAGDNERLLARERPSYDGAEPAGSSVAALNALRLATITSDDRWRRIAHAALRAQASSIAQTPAALHDLLLAVDYDTDAVREIVIVWPLAGTPEGLLEPLQTAFVPNRALLGATEGPQLEELARLAPLVSGKSSRAGQAAAYVCERGSCQLPTTDATELNAQLAQVRPLLT